MTMWFTSDLHLGHANIIRYCNRPFTDVDAMDAAIIDAINDRVAPDDVLWILGDVAMRSRYVPLVAEIRCPCRLVMGNHDTAKPAVYVELFEQVLAEDDLHGVPGHDDLIAMSHYPATDDGYGRAPAWLDRWNTGRWLLHGHTHGRWRQRGRWIDVGVDAWGGRPASMDEVQALIAAGPVEFLDPLPWDGAS